MTVYKKETKRTEQTTSLDSVNDIISNEISSTKEKSLNQLYDVIKMLSDIDRAIILLYLEKKSYKEIAEIIGSNSGNIGVKIQRIKNKLKKLIIKHHG